MCVGGGEGSFGGEGVHLGEGVIEDYPESYADFHQ